MARSFVPVNRDQRFLLPPDMREWLPPDHLVWFLIDLVGELDLSEFEARYRLGGQGRAAYHPAMLLTLLLYAYCQGVRSSRRIERACRQDIAYRVICGTYERTPDHATICRFRQAHEASIKTLFVQVLVMCERLGLLPLGMIAVDGSKLSGNASLDANRKLSAIEEEVAAILAEAAAVDEEENRRFGQQRGDELPAELADPRGRLSRLRAAAAYARQELARRQGPPRADRDDGGNPQVNVTDPDSRIMPTPGGGFVQGYNAQFAVGEGQILLALWATNRRNDTGLLGQMLDAVGENLRAAGVGRDLELVLADAGYFDTDDLLGIADNGGPDTLVATTTRRKQPTETPEKDPAGEHEEELAAIDTEAAAEQARRAAVYERIRNGELTFQQAAEELGLSIEPVWRGYHRWLDGGVQAVPVSRRRARTKAPSRAQRLRHEMEAKLADPDNRQRYKQRSPLVEGAIGQIKHLRNARWLSRRGLPAVDSELHIHGIVHNALKIRTALGALSAAVPFIGVMPSG